jgi:hypothetical protein
LSKIRALKPRVRMAEHAMQIYCGMLNAFVKKALRANSVRSTKDQQLQLQLQPRPKLQLQLQPRPKLQRQRQVS